MPRLKRRIALLAALSLLATNVPVPAQSPTPVDPELAAGIALVREGDFEAAVLKLDGVVRRLLTDAARQKEAARAYVYLGVAFLELSQELVARGKFQLAQGLDPQLRLDPHEFSPQQIRVFEAAREERQPPIAGPAASPRPGPSPSPPAAAAAEKEKKKKGSPLPWVLGGVAVAGGGAALAGSGGGGSGQTTTTSMTGGSTSSSTTPDTSTTSTAPPSSTTPPTTPTSTTMPSCSYSMSGPTPPNPYLAAPTGAGACSVQAAAGCAWTAESTASWINLTPPDSGSGNGTVAFTVAINTGPQRTGSIQLRQASGVFCEIRQNAPLLAQEDSSGAHSLTWTSDLDLAGAQGQVVVDGSSATFLSRGTQQGWIEARPGAHRIEATVVSADGRAGVWRFRLGGPLRPGSLRAIAGAVAASGADEIVFRLSGKPGERLLFTFSSR